MSPRERWLAVLNRETPDRVPMDIWATEEAFHTCELCGATDLTDPDRQFRITSDDIELCSECIDYEVTDDL